MCYRKLLTLLFMQWFLILSVTSNETTERPEDFTGSYDGGDLVTDDRTETTREGEMTFKIMEGSGGPDTSE